MRVLFFAGCRQISGVAEIHLTFSVAQSADQLWERLIAEYPGLESFRNSARLARNGEYVNASARFENGDEVAVIPPVSGG